MFALLVLAACVPPPSPAQRLTDTAYEFNTAMRFGRMDLAMAYVDAGNQLDFARRHSSWGNRVRVLDVDLLGMRPLSEESIEVSVAVTWHRIDEMTIHQSQIAQRWLLTDDDWRMMEERRVGGAPGLFDRKSKAEKEREQISQADQPLAAQ